jgi:molybdopterin biosynthesis enzyme MoaB
VAQLLEKLHFSVTAREVVPDDSIQIQNLLIRLARAVQFVVTTGGTGIAARDVTPEATIGGLRPTARWRGRAHAQRRAARRLRSLR